MIHLTWNLARHVTVTDSHFYSQVRYATYVPLMECLCDYRDMVYEVKVAFCIEHDITCNLDCFVMLRPIFLATNSCSYRVCVCVCVCACTHVG